MPQDFTKCVKNKGRVRTIKPNKNTYIHICYDKKGAHRGEVKYKNKSTICKGSCQDGRRCHNRTRNGKYCWRH